MNAKLKLLTLCAAVPFLASCLNDDGSTGQFFGLDTNSSSYIYANTASSYVAFGSTGRWTMTQGQGSDWCTISITEGYAAYYAMPVYFKLNTTGEKRTALFTARNTSADNVYLTFSVLQYACRGDGSYGDSPLATGVSGSDGSKITIDYDTLCRPTSFLMTKDGQTLHDIEISYSRSDTTVTVNDGSASLVGEYDSGYQPDLLVASHDTLGYFDQQSFTGGSSAFNVVWTRSTGEKMVQAVRFPGQSPRSGSPDTGYWADSIRYIHWYADGTERREFMAIEYDESVSNLRQTVDVNQLLLGVEDCNPFQFMALLSDARCQYVISTATTDDGAFNVSTTTNADGSVNTMTVTDKQGEQVTYTFAYTSVDE